MEKHIKSYHFCDICNEEFPLKAFVLHLKDHINSMKPEQQLTHKKKTTLNKGFYHPTIRLPDADRNISGEGGISILKPTSKLSTKYYIYKEKGQVKKVIKTIFKPKAKKEPISVGDELSCNLDDLLKTFEVEETEEKGELASVLSGDLQ